MIGVYRSYIINISYKCPASGGEHVNERGGQNTNTVVMEAR